MKHYKISLSKYDKIKLKNKMSKDKQAIFLIKKTITHILIHL